MEQPYFGWALRGAMEIVRFDVSIKSRLSQPGLEHPITRKAFDFTSTDSGWQLQFCLWLL